MHPENSNTQLQRAVFLDRDGVINRALVQNGKPYAPSTLEEFEILDGVETAISSLKAQGFQVVIVTNQPDLAKKILDPKILSEMHARIERELKVDAIKVCVHTDEQNCLCRKPRPGMLLEAAEEFSIDLSQSYMIGDRWRDMDAGKAAGCKTILIGSGYAADRPVKNFDAQVESLLEASQMILGNQI